MKTIQKLFSDVLTIVGLLTALAAPAHATFPGKNGRIAFIVGSDVFTMNSDGSDVRQLTDLGDSVFAFWEAWSPDSKKFVFTEFVAPDFNGQIWLMNADGSNQHLLVRDEGFDLEAPSFSPDGQYIVFTRCQPFGFDFFCGIDRIKLDGTGRTTLTPIQIGIVNFEPVYTPDGKAIAFDSFNRLGILGGLYLMDPDGSHIRLLTPPEIGAENPNWFPDGSRIAFSSHCCNPQNSNIGSVQADRSALKILVPSDRFNDFHPSWSPEGDQIAFQRDSLDFSSAAIFTANPDGSQAKQRLVLPLVQKPVSRSKVFQMLRAKYPGDQHLNRIGDGFDPQWGSSTE